MIALLGRIGWVEMALLSGLLLIVFHRRIPATMRAITRTAKEFRVGLASRGE